MAALVKRSGVSAATIRFYLTQGLLPAPERQAANRFTYDERHVELLLVIRLLRERRRLPLPAIRQLLPELVPDLTGSPEGGVFRPQMWSQLLSPSGGDGHAAVRGRVVDEALAAFSAEGYFEVSIDDVCRAAGIAKGSFYRYFSSKEQLLLAVVERATERVRASFADGAAATAPLGTGDRLAIAVLPFRTLLFDLASLSSRGRRAQGEALGALIEALVALATEQVGEGEAPATVDRVLAQLLRASAPLLAEPVEVLSQPGAR